jgi:integrase
VSLALSQGWLSEAWQSIGGGKIVDIRYVHRVSAYVTVYLTGAKIEHTLRLLPSRARIFSTSRGLSLSRKTEKRGWWPNASSADVPMPPQLETRLLRHMANRQSDADLLFVNKHGRPYSANKLREKQFHPLLKRLGIPRGGFHAAGHGATSEMLANGVAPTVVQKQMRHSDARITLGIYAHVLGDAQRRAVENHAEQIEKYTVQ